MKVSYVMYVFAGIAILLISFLYDAFFIGIPFQDPLPEMIEKREKQYLIKEIIMVSGLVIMSIGIIGMLIKKMNRH